MEYRNFGKFIKDYKPSALGFGCMRLPTVGNKPWSPEILEDEAIKMIRYAIDNGVNYIDTAYPYHGKQSEILVGKALKDGYREKVKIATKSPVFLMKEEGDFDKYLDEQLEKLGVESIDFYLLHALNEKTWNDVVLKFDYLKKAEKAKADGKIKHLGFSFHDKNQIFFDILKGYDKWEFCQIQLNYLDGEFQAGLSGFKAASEKGLGIIIMEPLLGGKLANLPKSVMEIFDETKKDRTGVEWALDYIWDMPEVSLVLSGMNNMQQVEENLVYASNSKPIMLSNEEKETITKVQKKFEEMTVISCTKCAYCVPCPKGVNIPMNFTNFNEGHMFDSMEASKKTYEKMPDGEKADKCVSCGVCEKKCPQGIKIITELKRVHETFS